MRDYELVLIVNPEIGEEKTEKTLESVKELVTSLEGKVKKVDDWGKRELTYPIKKFDQGQFFLLSLGLSPQVPVQLEKKLKLEEKIIRFLIVGAK